MGLCMSAQKNKRSFLYESLRDSEKSCGDFLYAIENGEAVVTGMTNAVGAVTVPAQFEGKPVTRIYVSAFRACKELTSITLPDSVRVIEWGAFYRCMALKTVTLSRNLKRIEQDAFEGCENLTEITLPNGLEHIGHRAFWNCARLEPPAVPDTVKEIENYTIFEGCVPLLGDSGWGDGILWPYHVIQGEAVLDVGKSKNDREFLRFPASLGGYPVKRIPGDIFGERYAAREIVVPEGVEILEDDAFLLCEQLEQIHLPSTLREIKSGALAGCSKLKEVELPDGLTEISYAMFQGSGLTQITIPEGVTTIAEKAFSNCKELTQVHCPESLQSIEYDAFHYCESLQELVLPRNLKFIDGLALEGTCVTDISIPAGFHDEELIDLVRDCTYLENIHVAPGNSAYSGYGPLLYNADQTILLSCPLISPENDEIIIRLAPTTTAIRKDLLDDWAWCLTPLLLPCGVVVTANSDLSSYGIQTIETR